MVQRELVNNTSMEMVGNQTKLMTFLIRLRTANDPSPFGTFVLYQCFASFKNGSFLRQRALNQAIRNSPMVARIDWSLLGRDTILGSAAIQK
jgi:hypothetical protein